MTSGKIILAGQVGKVNYFGTFFSEFLCRWENFDDFGVKNDQKVSYNMILMSRYMGQLHGGRGSKNLGKALPPSFRAMPARKRFFSCEVFPNSFGLYWTWACPPVPASQKIMVNKPKICDENPPLGNFPKIHPIL